MKTFVLAAFALSSLATSSWAAGPRAPSDPRPKAAASGLSAAPKAVVAIGRDGQDTVRLCSNENPHIEYRDCVNASTRDPNAKIRMG
jgi:hypothetical protein